jgi:hypothetical protein
MPQIVVTTLGNAGIATTLVTNPMATVGNQVLIDDIAIRIDLLTRVTLGNPAPHHLSGERIAPAERETQCLRGLVGPLPRGYPPDPGIVLLASDISPYLVAFDRVPFYRGENATFKGREGLDFFLTWHR